MVKVRIKPDPKSPLYGKRQYDYRVSAEGYGFRVVAIVRHFSVASAKRQFRRAHKKFRHEVRAIGLDPMSYPIKVERISKNESLI